MLRNPPTPSLRAAFRITIACSPSTLPSLVIVYLISLYIFNLHKKVSYSLWNMVWRFGLLSGLHIRTLRFACCQVGRRKHTQQRLEASHTKDVPSATSLNPPVATTQCSWPRHSWSFKAHSSQIPPTCVPPLKPVHWLFNCLNSNYITTQQLMLRKQAAQLVFK